MTRPLPHGRNLEKIERAIQPPSLILSRQMKFFQDYELNPNITLEDVASRFNLGVAHQSARKGKSFYESVQRVDADKDALLNKLQQTLLSGEYRTSEYRRELVIDSRKVREIYKLPYYPDRIVHWAIMLHLEPEFMKRFSPRTHAAIPGRGIHTAKKQVEKAMRNDPEGTRYCLKMDVRKFFPSVNHWVLKSMMDEIISDYPLRRLIYEIVDSVPEDLGLPIGNYFSQYAANPYLSPLDYYIETLEDVKHFTRYMDDIVIFGESKEALRKIFWNVEWFLQSRLFLEVKDNWQIFPVGARGVDFVGYRIWHNRTMIRKTTYANLRRNCRKITKHVKAQGGEITDHQRCSFMSELGILTHCTPRVKEVIFEKHFEEAIRVANIKLKPKTRKALCNPISVTPQAKSPRTR